VNSQSFLQVLNAQDWGVGDEVREKKAGKTPGGLQKIDTQVGDLEKGVQQRRLSKKKGGRERQDTPKMSINAKRKMVQFWRGLWEIVHLRNRHQRQSLKKEHWKRVCEKI